MQGKCRGNVFHKYSLKLKVGPCKLFEHFLLPLNQRAPYVACLAVWYYTQIWEFVALHDCYITIKHWRILQFNRLDITIANRLSLTLHSFSHYSIHPFNLALSSLPLLFYSLCSSFPGPPQASYPSSSTTLLMGSHSIPFANNGKCLSLKQTLSTTVMNSWSAYRKGGWNCTWPLRVPSWRDSVFFLQKKR